MRLSPVLTGLRAYPVVRLRTPREVERWLGPVLNYTPAKKEGD